jgi:vacuolar-type H+-ATPase subunit B/Vma2
MSIVSKEYRTISQIAGPLVFVEKTEPVGYNELATVTMPDGTQKRGQVLDTSTSTSASKCSRVPRALKRRQESGSWARP